jgi:hypothetical protein
MAVIVIDPGHGGMASVVGLERRPDQIEHAVVLMLESRALNDLQRSLVATADGLELHSEQPIAIRGAHFPRAMEVPRPLAASVTAALAINVTNPKLPNVLQAFAAIPKNGVDAKFSGGIEDEGGGKTHLQGLAAYKDFYVMTQSDEKRQTGRLLIADRRPGQQKLLNEFNLPIISSTEPFYFHAGGCQVIGDCLAVPIETGKNKSAVCFFDISDPANITELPMTLRITRAQRDAAAVGITNVNRGTGDVWLAAVYDSGTIDVYQSADLAGGAPFSKIFSDKIDEKHHQSLMLVTDTSERVFAIGLNHTFIGSNEATCYLLDLNASTIKPQGSRDFSPKKGAALRWGATLDILQAKGLVMHCTSKHYHADDGCHVSTFDPVVGAGASVSVGVAAAKKRGAAKKPGARKKAAKRTKRPQLAKGTTTRAKRTKRVPASKRSKR